MFSLQILEETKRQLCLFYLLVIYISRPNSPGIHTPLWDQIWWVICLNYTGTWNLRSLVVHSVHMFDADFLKTRDASHTKTNHNHHIECFCRVFTLVRSDWTWLILYPTKFKMILMILMRWLSFWIHVKSYMSSNTWGTRCLVKKPSFGTGEVLFTRLTIHECIWTQLKKNILGILILSPFHNFCPTIISFNLFDYWPPIGCLLFLEST